MIRCTSERQLLIQVALHASIERLQDLSVHRHQEDEVSLNFASVGLEIIQEQSATFTILVRCNFPTKRAVELRREVDIGV